MSNLTVAYRKRYATNIINEMINDIDLLSFHSRESDKTRLINIISNFKGVLEVEIEVDEVTREYVCKVKLEDKFYEHY